MSEQTKYLMGEDRIPHAWYNIVADLPSPPPPVLHPGTGQPVGPDDLAPLFPMALIGQEVSGERHIEIPTPVRDIYRHVAPDAALSRPAAREGARNDRPHLLQIRGRQPAGSHKPNTAVAQAFYNKEEGVKKLSTETGAGQWGSSLAFAGALFGLEVKVYMVKVSYNQKPYRRALMETYGAKCVASPSSETNSGKRDPQGASGFAGQPRHRDLGGGGGRGQEPRHQICARQRAQPRADASDGHRPRGDRADGGRPTPIPTSSSAAPAAARTSPASPSRSSARSLRDKKSMRVIAVEPAACPSLTRGKYAFDFGDTGHLTPLVKMHTLGSEFIPPGFHAGGLRYHGMAPLVSHLKELGLIEARAYHQNPCFEAGVHVRPPRGHRAGAGNDPRDPRGDRRGAEGARGGQVADHPVQPLGSRPFRHAGLHRLFRRQAVRIRTTIRRRSRRRSRICRRWRRSRGLQAAL